MSPFGSHVFVQNTLARNDVLIFNLGEVAIAAEFVATGYHFPQLTLFPSGTNSDTGWSS